MGGRQTTEMDASRHTMQHVLTTEPVDEVLQARMAPVSSRYAQLARSTRRDRNRALARRHGMESGLAEGASAEDRAATYMWAASAPRGRHIQRSLRRRVAEELVEPDDFDEFYGAEPAENRVGDTIDRYDRLDRGEFRPTWSLAGDTDMPRNDRPQRMRPTMDYYASRVPHVPSSQRRALMDSFLPARPEQQFARLVGRHGEDLDPREYLMLLHDNPHHPMLTDAARTHLASTAFVEAPVASALEFVRNIDPGDYGARPLMRALISRAADVDNEFTTRRTPSDVAVIFRALVEGGLEAPVDMMHRLGQTVRQTIPSDQLDELWDDNLQMIPAQAAQAFRIGASATPF
jgi:hypothetical protein